MLNSLLKASNGPLTKDLVQRPGSFGLGKIPERLTPSATTTSICGYCATGCQLKLHLDEDGHAINLSPQTGYPVNLGMACPKGWLALDPLEATDRGTTPLMRDPRTGRRQPIDWNTAIECFVGRFQAIQSEYGRESAAFLSTGQIPLEEMAFLGSLWKFGMGFLHGDANTRQCMATAVTAYKQSFGFDAPPYTYADFEQSDVIILTGANLAIAHPILWQRIMRNPRNPKIIVIDPRSTETAQAATQHVALKPKGDLPLYYALAHCIIRDGRTDPAMIERTEDFEGFSEFVKDFSPERVCDATGMSADEIEVLAQVVSEPGKRVSWWWTMGVNQSYEGVRTAQALINLALITGNIGKPGTGANSITGQCNAMGSRLFSNTTSMVGGHDFAVAAHRQKVSDGLGIPLERIPSDPTLAYDQILKAAEDGTIKALWVVATNPFHSWINNGRLARLREKLDFLVVQDMYHSTESAEVADLYLPAAGWGEKQGCLINSERRIATIKAVRQAPGQALTDFRIFRLIAQAWGCGELFSTWTHPEAVFTQLRDLTAGRPCDITGVKGYDHLDEAGGIQWPFPIADCGSGIAEKDNPQSAIHNPQSSERRLFEDGRFYTPSGKAQFLYEAPAAMPEPPCEQYPFLLLTGRGTSSQWHTQSRTSKSDILRKLYPAEAYIEIHPKDAGHLGIQDHDLIQIESRRGKITATAYIAPTVQRGQLFLPMHYPMVNQLTHPSFDNYSRQPNYKACAVTIAQAL